MNEILNLDRDITLFINGSHSLMWDGVIYTATMTLTWIPIGLVLLYLVYRHSGWKNLLVVLGMILLGIFISDQLSSSIFKPYFQRWRPTQDPQIMYLVDVVDNYRGGRFGFFSAHASNTFTVATFLALVFRHRIISILLFSWSILNCYTRMYLGVHYFGDIVVGTLFGLLIGYLVYRFYHYKFPTQTNLISSATTPSGYRVSDMQILSVTILLTYCLIFIVAVW